MTSGRTLQPLHPSSLKLAAAQVPYWRAPGGPEDLLQQLAWAHAHDEAARRIALTGQRFAQRYLTRVSRICYWQRWA